MKRIQEKMAKKKKSKDKSLYLFQEAPRRKTKGQE